jgi:lipopolysaccharide transport system ATP-binding protein
MRRAEINGRFDEIVSFAEVARFLDTPVKRYSTGMLVRLAFAVAAHLETEILLVDEVLAVGDVGFQRKCIGKMSDVAGEGRTVFFVSHNMATMQALCRRGIFLEGGRVHTDGSIVEAVTGYLRSVEQAGTIDLEQRTDRRGWHEVVLSSVEITGAQHDELLATGRRPGSPSGRTREGADAAFKKFVALAAVDFTDREPDAVLAPPTSQRAANLAFFFTYDSPAVRRYRVDVEIQGRSYLQDGIEGAAVFDVEQGTLEGRPVAGGSAGDVAVAHRWIVPSLD